MEGHGKSRKVKEGLGWPFPITRLKFQVRKVIGGGWVGGLLDYSVSPSPSSVPLDFEFRLWTLVLDLNLGLRTWI